MATAYTPLRRGTHRRGSRSCVQPALAHSPVQASTLALNRVLVSPTGFHGGGLAEKSGRDRCTRRTDQMVAPPTLLFGQKGAAGLIWPVERRDSRVAEVVSNSSCAWARRAGSAQGTRPSALPGSTRVFGCFSHQPEAPACHLQRAKPASTGRGGAPKAAERRRWPAVPTPRRAGPASGRSGGFAQSRGRGRSFDRGRPDLRSRHQQGSCGPFCARLRRAKRPDQIEIAQSKNVF